MLSRLISRVPRRQFSKYIEDNYGKELHRLANRPGIEVSPIEVFVYSCGAFLLIADVSSFQFPVRCPVESSKKPKNICGGGRFDQNPTSF